ncbi:MAG: GAF domain-containing protein [Polaromonas sp.]
MNLTTTKPAFGSVNLSNCDREPIHQLGAVQPIGFLVAISPQWIVVRASENIADFLGRPCGEMPGISLDDLMSPQAVHGIRNLAAALRGKDSLERAFGMQLQNEKPLFDVAVHRAGAEFIIECEPSEPQGTINTCSMVRLMIERLQAKPGFNDFIREAALQVRSLTRLDRVMVYQFLPDGSGEVIGESVRTGMDSFLGLRFPASDIPVQARALYVRNSLRLIADVNAAPVPVQPGFDAEGAPIDLSMSVLRSVSPIHLEYLKNMGLQASMSISILRHGKLWGLFACHNMLPVHIGFERRTAADLFAQMFSLMIDSRLRDQERAYEASAHDLHNQLMAAMAANKPFHEAVAELVDTMAGLVPADGIGLWLNGQATLKGLAPTREEFKGLVRFINRSAAGQVFATYEIQKLYPPAQDFVGRVAGLLAIPVSLTHGDYLVFFRQEVVNTVTWSGNPYKPVELGPHGDRLTPRKSFELWREDIQGQSAPWLQAELHAARSLRTTLLEVFFRLADVTEKERRLAAEKQDLLIAELNHRVRNILNLISGLVSQSKPGATDVESFAKVLGGRVQALARAHDRSRPNTGGRVRWPP